MKSGIRGTLCRLGGEGHIWICSVCGMRTVGEEVRGCPRGCHYEHLSHGYGRNMTIGVLGKGPGAPPLDYRDRLRNDLSEVVDRYIPRKEVRGEVTLLGAVLTSLERERAVSPVIGTVLMVGLTVILAAIIASMVFGMAGSAPAMHTTAVSVQANGADAIITLMAGDIPMSIRVSNETGSVVWPSPVIGESRTFPGAAEGSLSVVGDYGDREQLIWSGSPSRGGAGTT